MTMKTIRDQKIMNSTKKRTFVSYLTNLFLSDDFFTRNYVIIISLFSSIIIFIYCSFTAAPSFAGLPGEYWQKSFTFISGGKFSLDNYSGTTTGYIFPLMLLVSAKASTALFGSIYTGFYLLQSLLLGFLITMAGPYLFCSHIGKKRILFGSVLCVMFFSVFWRGLITMPFPDITALFFLTAGLAVSRHIPSFKSNIMKFMASFMIGIFFYSAANIKFLYLIPALAGSAIFLFLNKKDLKILPMLIIAAIIGWQIASLPQTAINKKFNIKSSMPIYSTSPLEITISQKIIDGKEYMRFEQAQPPDTSLYHFFDKAGFNFKITETSFKSILSAVSKYPGHFAAIYTRHFFNLMSPLYPGIFVTNGHGNIYLFFTLNALLVLYFIFSLLASTGSSNIPTHTFLISIPFIIAAASAIPLRPASQLFLPLFAIMYFYVSFNSTPSATLKFSKTKPFIYSSLSLLFLAVWFSIINSNYYGG